MKINKKILIGLIGTINALSFVSNSSCSKFDMIDLSKKYIPTIEPYSPNDAEMHGVTEDQARTIYLNSANTSNDVVKQDIYYYKTSNYEPTSGKQEIMFNLKKVDNQKGLFDYEFVQHMYLCETVFSETWKMDTTVYVKVSNANVKISYLDGWYITLGDTDPQLFGDEIIKGNVSGYINDNKFSNKEFTIDKNFNKWALEEKYRIESELIMDTANIFFGSYHLRRLKFAN